MGGKYVLYCNPRKSNKLKNKKANLQKYRKGKIQKQKKQKKESLDFKWFK